MSYSEIWLRIKQIYCSSLIGFFAVCASVFPVFIVGGILQDIICFKNPIRRYTDYYRNRGMSFFHDWHDWLGGLPFETASPGQITDYVTKKGYSLQSLFTCGRGLGCNEYIFRKY